MGTGRSDWCTWLHSFARAREWLAAIALLVADQVAVFPYEPTLATIRTRANQGPTPGAGGEAKERRGTRMELSIP